MPPTPEQAAAVDVGQGIRLFHRDQGTGHAVVLVHGLIEDYRAWSNQVRPLSQQYHVVAYSRRFSVPNENPGDARDDTVENNMSDLLGLINNLNIAPVHLVGRSYGGLIGVYFAHKHPELLRSLTLVEPVVQSVLVENPKSSVQRLTLLLTHPSVARNALQFQNSVIKESVGALKQGDPQGAVRILVDGDQGRPGAFEHFSEDFRKIALDNAKSIYTFESNWNVIKRTELRQIKVPTLLVRGENTTLSSAYISDSLSRLLPNAKEAIIAKSGHFSQFENPEEFNGKLSDFLAGNTG